MYKSKNSTIKSSHVQPKWLTHTGPKNYVTALTRATLNDISMKAAHWMAYSDLSKPNSAKVM